jgi:hypothetical protein
VLVAPEGRRTGWGAATPALGGASCREERTAAGGDELHPSSATWRRPETEMGGPTARDPLAGGRRSQDRPEAAGNSGSQSSCQRRPAGISQIAGDHQDEGDRETVRRRRSSGHWRPMGAWSIQGRRELYEAGNGAGEESLRCGGWEWRWWWRTAAAAGNPNASLAMAHTGERGK